MSSATGSAKVLKPRMRSRLMRAGGTGAGMESGRARVIPETIAGALAGGNQSKCATRDNHLIGFLDIHAFSQYFWDDPCPVANSQIMLDNNAYQA